MKLQIISIFLALILVGTVSAAGIGSPYWKGHPLNMNYGQTKIINFKLQNMVGDEDIKVKVEITQGSDIARLETAIYEAPAGTSDTIIPITIAIPLDYEKTIQEVTLEARAVAEDTGGMVSLGTGWTTSFDVILTEKPVEKSSLVGMIIILVIAIIIALIIIFILAKRRK